MGVERGKKFVIMLSRKKERKKMKTVTHTNDWLNSLPRIKKLSRWEVSYNGEYRGIVSANSVENALGFIPVSQYPERDKIVLVPLTVGG